MAKTRNFSGYSFHSDITATTKQDTERQVGKLRHDGYFVRVTKSGGLYHIWYRYSGSSKPLRRGTKLR